MEETFRPVFLPDKMTCLQKRKTIKYEHHCTTTGFFRFTRNLKLPDVNLSGRIRVTYALIKKFRIFSDVRANASRPTRHEGKLRYDRENIFVVWRTPGSKGRRARIDFQELYRYNVVQAVYSGRGPVIVASRGLLTK